MRRTTTKRFLWTLPLCLIVGCGGSSSPSKASLAPPHGGHMFALPDDRGFVEIKTDRAAPARGSRAKPAGNARIMAYFYQADGTTAMSPAPSDVKVTIGTEEKASAVALAPQTSEAGLYASEPGPYPDGFRGQIEARVNGGPVTVPFLFR